MFQAGDLMAVWGRCRISRAITLGTSSLCAAPRWAPSHVAIIAPFRGALHWFESTTLHSRPCAYAGIRVRGAQVHPLHVRLEDYLEGSRVALYRLEQPLDDRESELIGNLLFRHVAAGRSYDYAGAVLSGARIAVALGLLPRADLARLFCSEMVCDALKRVDRMCPLHNPASYNPGKLLRTLIRAGELRPDPVRTWSHGS